ncbi:MAG: mismatch-specific DNA-glycosylase [Chloroflexi bacterium]|nr:mismatch-specific DNA-glycosylase [Chloroflexota bacterium]
MTSYFSSKDAQEPRSLLLSDIIAPQLKVLFIGINPSIYSAEVGHHFAHPSNRFWQTLYAAGFTPRLLAPSEDDSTLLWGLGLTNIVTRATRSASELRPVDFATGRERLRMLVEHWRPQTLCFVGRVACEQTCQVKLPCYGDTGLTFTDVPTFATPSTSGRANRLAQIRLTALTELYRFVYREVGVASIVQA